MNIRLFLLSITILFTLTSLAIDRKSKFRPDTLSNIVLLVETIIPEMIPYYSSDEYNSEKKNERMREKRKKTANRLNNFTKYKFEKHYKYKFKFIGHDEKGAYDYSEFPYILSVVRGNYRLLDRNKGEYGEYYKGWAHMHTNKVTKLKRLIIIFNTAA